jgi:uncharacterized protein (DUF2141 family)
MRIGEVMSKLTAIAAAALVALTAQVASAQPAILGPEAEACQTEGKPAVLVKVHGLKTRTGVVRVQVYGSNPADFLAKGRKLKRVDVPVTDAGAMNVCVELPRAGNYAVAVRHDVDGNGKSGWNDGGGFSRNPKISLTSLKPDYGDVVVQVGKDVRPLDIVLNYRRGLSIRPIALAAR